jgi:hypothetical protein
MLSQRLDPQGQQLSHTHGNGRRSAELFSKVYSFSLFRPSPTQRARRSTHRASRQRREKTSDVFCLDKSKELFFAFVAFRESPKESSTFPSPATETNGVRALDRPLGGMRPSLQEQPSTSTMPESESASEPSSGHGPWVRVFMIDSGRRFLGGAEEEGT